MSRSEEFQSQTSEVRFVTKGGGAAVHIAHVYPNGNLATKCDKWGSSGARSSRIRPSTAEAPRWRFRRAHPQVAGPVGLREEPPQPVGSA